MDAEDPERVPPEQREAFSEKRDQLDQPGHTDDSDRACDRDRQSGQDAVPCAALEIFHDDGPGRTPEEMVQDQRGGQTDQSGCDAFRGEIRIELLFARVGPQQHHGRTEGRVVPEPPPGIFAVHPVVLDHVEHQGNAHQDGHQNQGQLPVLPGLVSHEEEDDRGREQSHEEPHRGAHQHVHAVRTEAGEPDSRGRRLLPERQAREIVIQRVHQRPERAERGVREDQSDETLPEVPGIAAAGLIRVSREEEKCRHRKRDQIPEDIRVCEPCVADDHAEDQQSFRDVHMLQADSFAGGCSLKGQSSFHFMLLS